MKLIHLTHYNIDKVLWNRVVSNSNYSMPYAYSWYLDIISPMWEAIVSEDYTYIMPLTVKQKVGIKYVMQPKWVQQLGIISTYKNEITNNIIAQFIKAIPYIFYDFNLNYLNGNCYKLMRINMIIDVNCDIKVIRSRYNKNTKRNIRTAKSFNLTIKKISAEQMDIMWQNENQDKMKLQQKTLFPLIQSSCQQNIGKCYGVFENDMIVAALFAIQTKTRFIYLAPVSNLRGKQTRAMSFLIDYLLEKLSQSDLKLFDCEGSMIEGVAQFYRGFGSVEEYYPRISKNRNEKLVNLIWRIKSLFCH